MSLNGLVALALAILLVAAHLKLLMVYYVHVNLLNIPTYLVQYP